MLDDNIAAMAPLHSLFQVATSAPPCPAPRPRLSRFKDPPLNYGAVTTAPAMLSRERRHNAIRQARGSGGPSTATGNGNTLRQFGAHSLAHIDRLIGGTSRTFLAWRSAGRKSSSELSL